MNTNKLSFCHNKNSKLKKKKKKILYRPARLVLPEIGRYGWYMASMAGIFSGTKQRGYMYRFACRYGIFRPYRSVRYIIDSLETKWQLPNSLLGPLSRSALLQAVHVQNGLPTKSSTYYSSSDVSYLLRQ